MVEIPKFEMNKLVSVEFEGYNAKLKYYPRCYVLFHENVFSIELLYEVAIQNGIKICSDLIVDSITKDIAFQNESIKNAYMVALEYGCSFSTLNSQKEVNPYFYKIPRFSEKDFEGVISKMGGFKIPESTLKTPDFNYNGHVFELKDLQEESFNNPERQNNIAKLFEAYEDDTINLKLHLNNEAIEYGYTRLLSGTIKTIFKKASKQFKSYKSRHNVTSCGVILINTGHYSLSHEKLIELVKEILLNQTKTIEYAFVFTQSVISGTYGDMYSTYQKEFVGKIPDDVKTLSEKIDDLIDRKMAPVISNPNEVDLEVPHQKPISFLIGKKIFFWNPEKVKAAWEK